MKKIIALLLILCCFTNVFSQQSMQSSEALFQKNNTIFKDRYIYKNQHFVDIDSSDISEGKLLDMSDLKTRERVIPKMLSNNFRKHPNDLGFKIDSIPETAAVNVNGVVFNNKNVLTKLSDYTIFHIKKDSIYTYEYHTKKDSSIYSNVRVKYQRPKAIVYQAHPNLPHNFFVFKLNSLEPIRYKSSSYSPVLDVFNTEEGIENNLKPRVMIDGRLQTKTFDYQNLNLKDIEKIEVFGEIDAKIYFGYKAKAGLVSVITKGSTFNLDWTLSNTRVIGEMQDLKGNWSVVSDTVLTNIDQFKNYRKDCLRINRPIYLINGNFETETMNRKVVDLESVKSIRIIESKKQVMSILDSSEKLSTKDFVNTKENTFMEIGSDTVYIETKSNNSFVASNQNVSSILRQINQIKNPKPESKTIYIVDNQEIDSEKLKQYKPKELEFVESLEGCDAISKYGKRAEFGVVIYRKKKIE